jgi:hypothetical protein
LITHEPRGVHGLPHTSIWREQKDLNPQNRFWRPEVYH